MRDEDARLRKAEKSMDYIQNIIDRLANDQFKIKSLSVTFFTVFVTFVFNYHGLHNSLTISLAISVLLFFWVLDTNYLITERDYRNLYDKVVCYANGENNGYIPYSLKIDSKCSKSKFWGCFLSRTLFVFYMCQVMVIVLFLCFM